MDDSLPLRPTARRRSTLYGPSGADLRAGFRTALRDADALDLALTRIRLDTLGVLPLLVQRLRRVRVVLARVRADELDAQAHAMAIRPGSRERLNRLVRLLGEGRTTVRAAPLGAWSPDFSLFRADAGTVALAGSHAFGRGGPGDGPLLLARVEGARAEWLATRFEELWSGAHDVTGAVEAILRRSVRWAEVPRRAG